MNMYDMFEGWGTDDVTGYANGYTLWTRTQSGQPGEPRYWLYRTPAELRGRDDRVIAAAIRGQEPVAKFGSAEEAFIAMKKLSQQGVAEETIHVGHRNSKGDWIKTSTHSNFADAKKAMADLEKQGKKGVQHRYDNKGSIDPGTHNFRKVDEQGVAEDAFAGINITMDKEDDEITVRADAGGRHLGHVLFVIDDGYLMPQDLEVDERFRGQGIAAAMYDYVKSQGYKIRRSGQQTDAGAAFWDKHRSGENVWEQGVSESDPSGLLSAAKTMNRSFIITADLAEGGRKRYRVRAQSERVAREKFAQHANQAKIVSVEEEFKEVDLGQADARKTTPAGKEEQEKTFSNFRERLKKIIHDVAVNPDIAPEHKKAVIDALVQKVVNEEQRRVKDTSAEKLAKRLKRSGYDMDERARYWDEKLRELERQRQEYEQDHSDVKEGLRDPEDNPCWKGYKPVGTKKKNGRTVPNCVPTNEEFAQFVVESLGVIELAERIFNGLEARYPDIVRRYGHDVVGDAVMDTAEEFAETGSTDVEAMIDSAVERLTQTVDQLDERKEVEADPAVLSTRVHDPELKWMLGRIKSHYPGLDKEEAFMKFVERALMHSEETDQKHDRAIKQIQQDVSNLKSAGATVAESRHYFAVAGTKDHELRRTFGMRKDRQGWYLSESADNFKSLYLEATRTFTQLK